MTIFGLKLGKSKKAKQAVQADKPPAELVQSYEPVPTYAPAAAAAGGAQYAHSDYSQSDYSQSSVNDLTFADYATGVPNIRLSEMFASFGRQLKWLIPLFLLGTLAAWYLTKDFKRTYSGDGRVMVQLGEEYVYNPITGNANGGGLMQTPDTITLNEVAIIKNAEVMDQVIGEMTPDDASKRRFNRDAFSKLRNASNERERQDAYMELRKFVDRNFVVMAQPKSSIIDLVFKHEDPQVAVETLNAFIDAYLSYRRTIFVEGSGDIISERREATEQQLSQNERAIASFLKKNTISDFGSEQKGLQKRTEDLKAALNLLRAQIAETETSLAVVEDQLRGTQPTINLYVDDRASQRIAQAELELKQLLAKYLPSSDPVKQKQTELAELKSLQSSYNGRATGGRRVGPNPVHQALVTRRNTLKATADSYREKEFTLQNQLNSADSKVRRLTSLSPKYQNLLRERDTLSTRLKNYNAKEQEALVNQSQAEANAENIKVISYAKYPNKGRNMRLLMFALATVGWGFTLFMLALLKVFLDPKLYAQPGPVMRARQMPPQPEYVPESTIPEPVAPYVPPAPLPEQAPAAEPQYQPAQPAFAEGMSATRQNAERRMASSAAAAGLQEWAPGAAPQTATQMEYGQSESYTEPVQYDAPPAMQAGSAALDIYSNPYAQTADQTTEDEADKQTPINTPPPSS